MIGRIGQLQRAVNHCRKVEAANRFYDLRVNPSYINLRDRVANKGDSGCGDEGSKHPLQVLNEPRVMGGIVLRELVWHAMIPVLMPPWGILGRRKRLVNPALTLHAANVQVKGQRVYLHLPNAELFTTRLDSGRTRVYSRQTGWLVPTDPNLETEVRQEGERQIHDAG